MKHKLLYILAALSFAACSHDDISERVSFDINLDPSQTYRAGEPVKFIVEGNVDNLLFYSGETGSQYKYKDRYNVSMESVKSAKLQLDIKSQYGNPGGLDIYVSNKFKGLSGTDGAADRAAIKQLEADNMTGWKKMDFDEQTNKWTSNSIDVNESLDNFCMAIHWHPKRDGKSAQRTYLVNGGINLEIEGAAPTKLKISDLGLISVMMNEEIKDPYKKNSGKGSIIFNAPQTAEIQFKGVAANDLPYALDGWVFCVPSKLDKVPNDKGVVVKNMQNYVEFFQHVYMQPGDYTATIVGTNRNYKGASSSVKELHLHIADKL